VSNTYRPFSLTTFATIAIFLAEGLLAVGTITYILNGAPFVGLGYFTIKGTYASYKKEFETPKSGLQTLINTFHKLFSKYIPIRFSVFYKPEYSLFLPQHSPFRIR
jgi:hypothetical protein